MTMPSANWLAELPTDRLIAEYSMWSADLIRIGDDLVRIEGHADVLHIDVADGHFAPALLFFPDVVAKMRAASQTPIHVHLMVADAVLVEQVSQFADAGADLISIHVENAAVADEALALIRARNVAAGMVLRVETAVASCRPYLGRLDFLTLLGTAIGVKGQGLDPAATDRLRQAASLIEAGGRRIVLAADGGIREHTVPLLREAGAQTVVLGSLAFGADDLGARMRWLHAL
ncbi:MAG: ribulose-phosphate 3-epimerase [Hyphomicrobiales bacterium]|nr:ribulose-phosphate 3-epimerase [Hyphomicrobiales bacterium]